MRVSFHIGNEFLKRVRFFPGFDKAGCGRDAPRRGSPGYSLIELLIVLAIIGLIVGLVGPRVLGYLETSKVKSARLQIDNFGKALDLYYLDAGRYPNSAESLDALIHKPGAVSNWAGPYLKGDKLPPDPWGNKYNYRSPGEHGKYDLYSYGADGREGGTGNDADVTSWGLGAGNGLQQIAITVPLFSYKALTLTGETADGLETADSLEQLRDILSSRDLILKTGRVSRGTSSLGRPPLKHIANFNRELTVLLRAGISIPETLSLLSVRPGQPKLEKALQVVTAEVKRGGSLSDAMGKAPAVFDAPYRALVATGEQSGALPVCLERYQDYVDLKQKIGGQVSKAMIYPIVLLIVLSGVLTFLFVEVIPNFVSMYAELGSSLPAPTQVLIAIEENFPLIALTIGGTLGSVWLLDRLWTSKPEGAIARDKALLLIPVFGHFKRASAAAATARMLSILISSGATVPKALSVAGSSVSDRYFAQVLAAANRAVKDGNPLARALTEGGMFRPTAMKMIQAGEASGSLDKMLAAVAAQQEEELATSLTRLTSMMEPAVLLIAGVLVGCVVIAMYLPIFTLTDLIK